MKKSRWSSWMGSVNALKNKVFGASTQPKKLRGLKARGLRLEPLEQRQMLTILYWDPDGIANGNDYGTGAGLGGSSATYGKDWDSSTAAWVDSSGVYHTLGSGDTAVFWGDAGTVTISGTVSADSVEFRTDGYTINGGTLSLANVDTQIVVNSGMSATISSIVAGNGLTKTGEGSLTMDGSSGNTYTGTTTMVGGDLVLAKSSGVAIPGNLTYTGTATTNVYLDASEQIGNAAIINFNNTGNTGRFCLQCHTETVAGINTGVDNRGVIQNTQTDSGFNGVGTIIVDGAGDSYFAGYLRNDYTENSSGTVSLEKRGDGTLTLSGTHISYTGTTTIDGGTLQIGNGGTTGTLGTGAVTIGGNGDLEFYRTDTTFFAIANTLSGTGDILFRSNGTSGVGSYQLTGTNNSGFSGTITVDDARLKATSNTNFGNASLEVLAGGQIYVSSTGSFGQSLTLNGTGWPETAGTLGALRLSGGAIWSGDITLDSDTRITAYSSTGTITGNITGNHVLAPRYSGTITLAPTVGNDFSQLKVGTSMIVVTGSNALDEGTVVTMEGGTLKLNGNSFTVAGLTGTSGQIQNGLASTTSTLTVNVASGTNTYSGTLVNGSGILALTKTGAGKLELAGSSANTYTGDTTISGGYLRFKKPANIAAVSGNIHFTGTSRSYLQLYANEQIADSAVIYFENTDDYGCVCLRGYTEMVSGISDPSGHGVIENVQTESGIDDDGTLIVNNSTSYSYNGYLRNEYPTSTSNGKVSLVKQGSGTLTLSGSHIYHTGGTTVTDGTLVLQNVSNTGFQTTNIVNNATLTFNNTSVDTTFNGVISGSGNVRKEGDDDLTLGGTTANTYTGTTTITEGKLWLNKSAGVNAIPGDIHFAGTTNSYLYLNADEQIANTADIFFDNTEYQGRLCLYGHTETVATINTDENGLGVIQNTQSDDNVTANGTLIVNNSVDCFYNGYLRDRLGGENTTGTLSIVKQGDGKLTLDRTNTTYTTYTGTTTISAGTLQVGDDDGSTNATLGTGAVTVNGNLVFYRTDDVDDRIDIANVFSGTGNITLKSNNTQNTGSYSLTADNTGFTGTLAVTDGARLISNDPANFGGSGMEMIYAIDGGQIFASSSTNEFDRPLTISGNGFSENAGTLGALRLGSDTTWSGNITLAGDASISAYNTMATITGNIGDGTNDYRLTFRAGDGFPSSGILLNPTTGNTYSGGTLIAGAIVQLGKSSALPANSALQLGDPTLGFGGLDLKGNSITLSSITTGAPSLNHSVFWDEISNTNYEVSGSPTAILTIDNDDDCEYAGVLSGKLALVKEGDGTLTLAGSNYNTGSATVNDGTLEVEVSYLGTVTTSGTGIAVLPDAAWYSLSMSNKSGEYASEFSTWLSDDLDVETSPIKVYGDWKTAVMASVEGFLTRVSPNPAVYTFGSDLTGQAYRVGTVQELNAAVRAMHNDVDAFELDSSLSNNTKLIVLESLLGYSDCDYDYDDVYWVVTANQITIPLTGDDVVEEGSTYTLGVGQLTNMAGTITSYTIHWGDGSAAETYSAAQMEAVNFQPTHVYADGLTTPRIRVDATIGGNSYEYLGVKDITVQDVASTFTIYADSKTEANTNIHRIVFSVDDPGVDTITGLTIHWGNDGTTTGTVPGLGNDWGNGITRNADGTWTATYTYSDDTNWLDGLSISATDGTETWNGVCEKHSVILVSTLSDAPDSNDYTPGHLSLREALALAELDTNADTIMFDPGLFTSGTSLVPQTITLTSGQLDVTSNVTILAPAGGLLTINANSGSRVFHVGNSTADITATFSGLKITGGSAGNGGGIYVGDGDSATILNSLIYGNIATTGGSGGGIYVEGNADVRMTNTTIAGNTASGGNGGGLFVATNGLATINNTIIASNSATTNPDAAFNDGLTAGSDYNLIGVWSDTSSTPGLYTLYGNSTTPLSPAFVSTSDYRLSSASRAINAGENDPANDIATDLTGKARIFYDTVDIGAYEYTPTIWYWDTNGDEPGFGTGTGTWSTTATNWTTDPEGKTATQVWSNSQDRIAVFAGTAGTVSISGDILVNSVQFLTSGYTISGGNKLELTACFHSVHAADGVTATINSVVDGESGLIKTGPGIVKLTAANSYTTTIVDEGILVAKTTDSLPDYATPGQVVVHAAATIGINMGGEEEWNNTMLQTLLTNATFNAGSSLGIDTSNAGSVVYNGVLAGHIGLVKLGSAPLVLSGNNTYTGDTTLLGGILQVDGSIYYSNVIVDGGILTGTGTTGDVLVKNGTVSPGINSGTGTLNLDNLVLEQGSIYSVDLSGTSTDKLDVTGLVHLGNATLNLTGSLTENDYQTFVLIDNDGTDDVAGTFDGRLEGSTVTINNVNYWITYRYDAATAHHGTGNDVALVDQGSALTAPATLTVTDVTTSSITLQWPDVANETDYLLQRRTDDSYWQDLTTVSANTVTYTDPTVTEGTRYSYRILPTINGWHITSSVTATATAAPAAPTNFVAFFMTSRELSFAWTDTSAHDDPYIIEHLVDSVNNVWEIIDTVAAGNTTTTITDQSFEPGITYNFRIRAYSDTEYSAAATDDIASGVDAWPESPTDLEVSNISGLDITIEWTNRETDTGTTYHIERKLDGTDTWSEITTGQTLAYDVDSYIDNDLPTEGRYSYRVYATNSSDVESAYSNTILTGALSIPTNFTVVSMTTSGVSLSWEENSNWETNYVVVVSDGTNTNEILLEADSTSCFIPGTYTPSTSYDFQIMAIAYDLPTSVVDEYVSSDMEDATWTCTSSTLPTPTNIVATQSTTACEVEITWAAVSGADYYDVYRLAENATQPVYLGTIEAPTTPETPNYTDTSVPADDAYFYKIIARDASDISSNMGTAAAAVDAYFAQGDFDNDGLMNSDEFLYNTDLDDVDSDKDGLFDGWEVTYDYDPLDPDSDNDSTIDGNEDLDADGLSNLHEQNIGCDPTDTDTDDDGTSDADEYDQGSDPNSSIDGGETSEEDLGNFTVTVGDGSDSHSELWALRVGNSYVYEAPGYGQIGQEDHKFEAGYTYDIVLEHKGTNRTSSPDYDWTAYVDAAADNTRPFAVFDEGDLLGEYLSPDNSWTQTAQLWLPKLDVYLNSSSDIVIANTGDYDQDGIIDSDLSDSDGIPNENLVSFTVELSENIVDAGTTLGDVVLYFDYETSMRIFAKGLSPFRQHALTIEPGMGYTVSYLQSYLNPDESTDTKLVFYIEGLTATESMTPIKVYAQINGTRTTIEDSTCSCVLDDSTNIDINAGDFFATHFVDVAIDSDNNSDIKNGGGPAPAGTPQRRIEEQWEDDSTPGKVLAVGQRILAIFSADIPAEERNQYTYSISWDPSVISLCTATTCIVPSENNDFTLSENEINQLFNGGLTLYLDGIRLGSSAIFLTAERPTTHLSDRADVTVGLDIDTDSDNDGVPEWNTEPACIEEDNVENQPNEPGRLLLKGDAPQGTRIAFMGVGLPEAYQLQLIADPGLNVWRDLYKTERVEAVKNRGAYSNDSLSELYTTKPDSDFASFFYVEGASEGPHYLTWQLVGPKGEILARDIVKFTVLDIKIDIDITNPNDSNSNGIVDDFADPTNGHTGNAFQFVGDAFVNATTVNCTIPFKAKVTPDIPLVRDLLRGRLRVGLDVVANSTLTWSHASPIDSTVGSLVYNAFNGLWESTATFTGVSAVPANSYGRVPGGDLFGLFYGNRVARLVVAGSGKIVKENYEVYYGNNLVIDGQKMALTTYNQAHYISDLIGSSDSRQEMYEKMVCSTETFTFATLEAAKENFDMREKFIANMQNANTRDDWGYSGTSVHLPQIGSTMMTGEKFTDAGMFNRKWDPGEDYTDANSTGSYEANWQIGDYWVNYYDDVYAIATFKTKDGVSPYLAIQNVTSFYGECAGSLHIALLKAVADVLGEARFNAIHPTMVLGAGVDCWTDFYKHIDLPGSPAKTIDTATYVPGDHAYIRNPDDYFDYHPGGSWQGENLVYDGNGTFTGLLRDEDDDNLDESGTSKTESWWRTTLYSHYYVSGQAGQQPATAILLYLKGRTKVE